MEKSLQKVKNKFVHLEREIDLPVYVLYELTPKEIEYIEKEVQK